MSPLYEFACPACGEGFDELAPAGAAAAPCPACGAAAERRFTVPARAARMGLRGAAARDSEGRRGEREAVRSERIDTARRDRAAD